MDSPPKCQVGHTSTIGTLVHQCTSLRELHVLGNPCFPTNAPSNRESLLSAIPRAFLPGFRLTLNSVEVTVGERVHALDARIGTGVGSTPSVQMQEEHDAARLHIILQDDVHVAEDALALDLSHRGLVSLAGLVCDCAVLAGVGGVLTCAHLCVHAAVHCVSPALADAASHCNLSCYILHAPAVDAGCIVVTFLTVACPNVLSVTPGWQAAHVPAVDIPGAGPQQPHQLGQWPPAPPALPPAT
jgi:hypothetical protein